MHGQSHGCSLGCHAGSSMHLIGRGDGPVHFPSARKSTAPSCIGTTAPCTTAKAPERPWPTQASSCCPPRRMASPDGEEPQVAGGPIAKAVMGPSCGSRSSPFSTKIPASSRPKWLSPTGALQTQKKLRVGTPHEYTEAGYAMIYRVHTSRHACQQTAEARN